MTNASVTIPFPDDWHVHLRDDHMLSAVVEYSARRYRCAMVMPNLRPPVTSTTMARDYRDRIMTRAQSLGLTDFQPRMTLFASADLDLEDLRAGVRDGVVTAVKFYPPGATTNSDQAKGSLGSMMALLECIADLGIRLLVHAESTDPAIDIFSREAAFLETDLAPICSQLPDLGVTVEHISTRAGVEFVEAHPQTVASITPHHLARERTDLLAHGMEPDLFCKPIINSADDQQALIAAATSTSTRFFLGTDSAPHPTTAKYKPKAAAGIFNAPYGLEVTAEVFHQAAALDRLANFVSLNGASVYGVEPSTRQLQLTRLTTPQPIPQETLITESGDEVVFFGTDEAAWWSITGT